jgi:hypothetical protein
MDGQAAMVAIAGCDCFYGAWAARNGTLLGCAARSAIGKIYIDFMAVNASYRSSPSFGPTISHRLNVGGDDGPITLHLAVIRSLAALTIQLYSRALQRQN